MKIAKIISIFSACVAVVSISASVLMMRQKDDDFYIPTAVANDNVDEYSYEPQTEVYIPEETTTEQSEPETEAETEYDSMDFPVYDYVPSNSGMTEQAKLLMKQNDDVVGWLKINNTQIDYPLLKDPGDITPNTGYGSEFVEYNEFYLHHNMNRQYLFEGNIYMDCRDNFGSDEDQQSENIVIYGHNMLNGSQFGNLRLYKDTSYYWTNPFVYLSSNYKDYEYVIVSFCITSGNADTDFRYWDMEELDTKADFDYYVNRIKRDQLLDTGVDIKYGDKLLTLSTCHADADNTRFIVLARRLRDGEIAGDMSTIQKTAPLVQNRRKTVKK
ncbi:MAG: class B sortase [Ruminococcus flavefaciens]|nr:class B sortase [Ruminococcus flavefaciens]